MRDCFCNFCADVSCLSKQTNLGDEFEEIMDDALTFQSADKAKKMAKAISTPGKDSVKAGKGRWPAGIYHRRGGISLF